MKLKREIKAIKKEISRSKRYGFHFGLLVIHVDNSIPVGLSKTLPGRTLSYHVMENQLRYFDCLMLGNFFRTYYVILPQTFQVGSRSVKRRIKKLAWENSWGPIRIGLATYPEDGDDPKELLRRAVEDSL